MASRLHQQTRMRRRAVQHRTRPNDVQASNARVPSVHHFRGRVRAVVSACFIGVILALTSSTRSKAKYLPDTYAVCSRGETHAIYTVDQSSPTVACVVVSGDVLVDRGSLVDIRRKWGDKDTTGPATQSYGLADWVKPKDGVKIYYLQPGEAMYPGLADAHAHILGTRNDRPVRLSTLNFTGPLLC